MNVQLLTYNVFLRPYLVKTNKSDFKTDRLKYIGDNVLPCFDIVCFEEMFDTLTHRKHEMIELGLRNGFRYFAQSPSPLFSKTSLIDGGLLVLSRYPIIHSE